MNVSNLINKISDMRLYKEGEFSYLDFCDSKLNAGVLTFIDDEKYISKLSPSISCIICHEKIAKVMSEKYGVLISNNPRADFYRIHNYLSKSDELYKKDDFNIKVGSNCRISDKAMVSNKDVIIGNNVIIEEFVVIREGTIIGDNSILRAGCKIGGEGFQFDNECGNLFIEHSGGVIIGKNVEMQYNTCVDKAVFPWDNTQIGNNTKLDNLIHVGHAAKIGENCRIAANALIGGSTVIGNDSWIGVSATISNGLIIGSNSSIKLGSVVTKNVPDGASVSGNFAIEHSKFIKFIKSIS